MTVAAEATGGRNGLRAEENDARINDRKNGVRLYQVLGSFRSRLLAIGLLAFLPAFAALVYDAVERRSVARAESIDRIEALIHTVHAEYMTVLEQGEQLGTVLQQLGRIRQGRTSDCSRLLRDIEPLYRPFPQIAVTNEDGDIVCSAVPLSEPTSAADRQYFKDAVRKGGFVVSEPLIGRVSKRPVKVLAMPYLNDKGSTAGVIIVSLDLSWISETFARFELFPGSSVGMASSDGIVAVRYPGDPGPWVGKSIRESAFFRQILAHGEKGTFTEKGLDGVERIFTFVRHDMHGGDTIVWAGVPAAALDDPINASFLARLAWLVAAAAVLFALAWGVGKRIFLNPLQRVLDAAERIAAGDLSARSGAQTVSGELGSLSRAFDRMAGNVERHEADLRRTQLLLTVLSEGNRAMLRSSGEAQLLERICAVLVDIGRYPSAWIALQPVDGPTRLRAVEGHRAGAGRLGADALGHLQRLADHEASRAAFVEKRTHVGAATPSADSPSAPLTCAGLAERAWIALPLRNNEHVFGVLGVHASKPDGFAPRELALLQETADDVGFGIGLHRLRLKHAEAQQALLESEERFRLLAEHSRDGMWLMRPEPERILYVSPAVESIWGRPAQALYARGDLRLNSIHEDDRDRVRGAWEGWLAGTAEDYAVEYRVVRPDGALRYVHDRGEKIRDDTGRIRYLAGVSHDLTERKAYEERLRHSATHDELTGLPNRLLFVDLVEQALPAAQRAGRFAAVLSLNLDRLKHINDSLGHDLGDAVLRQVGRMLRQQVRPGDAVARLGGDDFAVLLPDLHRADDAGAVARKIQAAFQAPLDADGRQLTVSASFGVAIYPQDGSDASLLLRNSHSAMHRARTGGGGVMGFFTEKVGERVKERLDLEQALGRALQNGELSLHYQPQVDAASGRLVGAEALLRWERPGAGMISPARFIPVAEETGAIVPIGEWVLREACAQAKRWRDGGMPELRMGVNVAARQFWDGRLIAMVDAILRETGHPAAQLELEVTEGVVMRDAQETIATLRALKEIGIAISLDDFGTGYSSLAFLRQYPIDRLKVDRSFINDITDDSRAATMVRGVIELAHGVGFSVVAEGVETAEQAKLLALLRCDELQGYHISRPLPAPEFERLLHSNWPRPGKPPVV